MDCLAQRAAVREREAGEALI
ncbi:hypothetical protein PCAR4_810020 [Paraburkholderia caribensis]|nr:hypothetical protein PCAR4_810020 [Paraburkholderia caribensis]